MFIVYYWHTALWLGTYKFRRLLGHGHFPILDWHNASHISQHFLVLFYLIDMCNTIYVLEIFTTLNKSSRLLWPFPDPSSLMASTPIPPPSLVFPPFRFHPSVFLPPFLLHPSQYHPFPWTLWSSSTSRSVILFCEIFRLFGENVVSRCEESDFQCLSGECLNFGKLCDGAPDCRDHSDEDVDRWVLQKSRALNSIFKTC